MFQHHQILHGMSGCRANPVGQPFACLLFQEALPNVSHALQKKHSEYGRRRIVHLSLALAHSLSFSLSHSIVLSTLHCWVHNCLVMLIEVEIHVPPQKNCEIKNLTGITVEWNSEFDRSGYFQMARRGQQWHYELYYSNWLSTMYSVWVITSNKMPQILMLYTKG